MIILKIPLLVFIVSFSCLHNLYSFDYLHHLMGDFDGDGIIEESGINTSGLLYTYVSSGHIHYIQLNDTILERIKLW